MAVENKGNLIIRRAFFGAHGEFPERMETLRRTVNKAMSTAYQMTEEVGPFGSGTPSPLYVLCELIRQREELDRKEGVEISTAQELAQYPLTFLSQLRGEISHDGGAAVDKLVLLLKDASDANYMLRGRDLKELTPGELKDFGQKMMNVYSVAHELGMMTDGVLNASEDSYPGIPLQKDRPHREMSAER